MSSASMPTTRTTRRGSVSDGPWDNPVGEIVAAEIEPLDCTVPCVVDDHRNPDWVEPKQPPAGRT